MNLFPNGNQKLSVIAAATTLILYSTYKLIRSTHKLKSSKEIPEHSSGYPYIGHLLSLGDLPAITMAKWHEELGPIIRIRMGVQTWISIGDPILAHKLFVTHGHNTSYRPFGTFTHNHYSKHGKGIVFANPGEGFKESRAAVMTILSAQALEKHRGLLEKEADDLVNRLIEDTAKHGFTIPRTSLRLSSLNVIMSLGVGKRFESVEDPEFIDLNEKLHNELELLAPKYSIAGFIPALRFIDYILGYEKTMKKHVLAVNKAVCELFEGAYKSENPSFVKSAKDDHPLLNEEDMVVVLTDFLGAGTDTVSVALTWIIAVMCNYPEEQAKVREELDQFINKHGRLPHYNEQNETPYSYCVIREVFRFRGQATLGIPHFTREEVEVDGYVIPAGTTLVYNAVYMHFNPDLYDEPHKFMPERFMKYSKPMTATANGKITERDHYAFGWGRRICPGIHLADMEIYNAFVRVFSSSIVEADGDLPDIANMMDISFMLVPVPYKVKFTKRIQ